MKNISDDRVFETVLRPQMASEALELIEQGKEIEQVLSVKVISTLARFMNFFN